MTLIVLFYTSFFGCALYRKYRFRGDVITDERMNQSSWNLAKWLFRVNHKAELSSQLVISSQKTMKVTVFLIDNNQFSPPWILSPPSIRLDLTQIPIKGNNFIQHIRQLIQEHPEHTICLSDGSKSNSKSAYAYSINGNIKAQRIHNITSMYTA